MSTNQELFPTESRNSSLQEEPRSRAPRKKGAMAYVHGAHTTARIPRDLYKKAKSYAAEHDMSISQVLHKAIRNYIREARVRIKQGKPLDLPLRSELPEDATYIVSWHGDPELTKELRSIAAQDGVNIRTAITIALDAMLAGWTPSVLKEDKDTDVEA